MDLPVGLWSRNLENYFSLVTRLKDKTKRPNYYWNSPNPARNWCFLLPLCHVLLVVSYDTWAQKYGVMFAITNPTLNPDHLAYLLSLPLVVRV